MTAERKTTENDAPGTMDSEESRKPRGSDDKADQEPPPGGFDAVFGKWPGDETDEELEEALRRLK